MYHIHGKKSNYVSSHVKNLIFHMSIKVKLSNGSKWVIVKVWNSYKIKINE